MTTRVLLADPEETLLEIYCEYLVGQGFDVEMASSCHDCLEKLQTWNPHVLVLEPDSPNGWGRKVLDHWNSYPERRGISVLILSRNDPTTIGEPVREYHIKPISMAELVSSIRRSIAHLNGEKEVTV